MGKTLAAMVMSVASPCAARVAWIWITFQFVHKLNILLLGYPITWAIGAAMVFLYMKKSNWLKKPESAEDETFVEIDRRLVYNSDMVNIGNVWDQVLEGEFERNTIRN